MEFEQMKQALTGEYQTVFSHAWVYGTMHQIGPEKLSDRLTELFDLLLTAQTENKTVQRVIGKDPEKFCRDFYQDFTVGACLEALALRLYRFAAVFFVIEFLRLHNHRETAQSDLVPYLFGLLLLLVFELLCRLLLLPLMFKHKKLRSEARSGISLFAYGSLLAAMLALEHRIDLSLYVPTQSALTGSGIYCAVFWIVRLVLRYRKYGSFRSVRRQLLRDSYYRDLGKQQTERTMETSVLKRWRRRFAKPSARYTQEEVLKKLKKEGKTNDLLCSLNPFLWSALLLRQIVVEIPKHETLLGALIPALVMAAFVLPVYLYFQKTERVHAVICWQLIREYEDSGMPLQDFLAEKDPL